MNQGDQQVEEWLELANGCICCSVKDQGVNAIESLMERQGSFDYILLETTGLAHPGNIAPIFWVDEGLGSTIYLDGIVTLVDAKNILKCLDEPVGDEAVHDDQEHEQHVGQLMSTAHLQVSHADVIVINKADIVSDDELAAVEDRLRSINALADFHVTDHSKVPELEGVVLDLHAYDNVSAEALETASKAKGHSHLDPTIGTMTLDLPVLSDKAMINLDGWLRSVLWEERLPRRDVANTAKGLATWEIHRIKGRIPLQNGGIKMLQGVREIFELTDGPPADAKNAAAEHQTGKMVLIGKHIGSEESKRIFQNSLETTLNAA